MQASHHHSRSNMSNTLYCHPVQNLEPYSTFQHLNHHLLTFNNNTSDGSCNSIHNFDNRYCTLEASTLSINYITHNSPSTVTFSPTESPLSQQEFQSYPSDPNYGSPISGSCIIEDMNNFKQKLEELESVMLGPDIDILETCNNTVNGTIASDEIDNWRQMMLAIPGGDLRQILIACAKAVSNNDSLTARWLISELRQLVSVSGEPIQRLGAYMLEGLVAKLNESGNSIYKSLKCKEPTSSELLSYMHILYEVCPYFKFGYMSANGVIAEAMKKEDKVHIVDFQIGQGSQWVALIQAFAARPGGPPRIRITGIDDATSAYARGGGLNIVGQWLSKLAKAFKVPFEFLAVAESRFEVLVESLGIQPDEALAVNFAFMLHHTPDESVSTENHRDRLLRMVKGLNPKVVTLVEQECNTNTTAFYPRFIEALDYYTAMFESIDASLPREHKEGINVERQCLATDVVNIIACEGIERVERHELLGKWRLRFKMAGFSPYPLSYLVNATIKTLLENYCDKYRVEERDGAVYLGWLNRYLVASCAWK